MFVGYEAMCQVDRVYIDGIWSMILAGALVEVTTCACVTITEARRWVIDATFVVVDTFVDGSEVTISEARRLGIEATIVVDGVVMNGIEVTISD